MQMDYQIVKDIATISDCKLVCKKLTLTSWNGRPAKLDLRIWRKDEGGEEAPGKGITLTEEEAEALLQALIQLQGDCQNPTF